MISRRIFAAVALLCAFVAPCYAQQTKAALDAQINSTFLDNTVGAITPSGLRAVTSGIVNSIMPTAPVVSGNFPSFNGTTGLLQDSGSSTASVPVSIASYGAKCDNSTDDTVAIQNAWNAAAAASTNVWLGGVGTGVCKFSSLTAPAPTGIGKSSFLTGPGSSIVTLNSTIAGSGCAINITANYTAPTGYLNGAFQGFTLQQNALNQTGNGICANQIIQTTFRDVTIQYFSVGFQGLDSILLTFDNDRFWNNNQGVTGAMVSFSPPNGWNFINGTHFVHNNQNAASFTNPNLVNFVNVEFESNGLTGTNPATIDVIGAPDAPVVGVNVESSYFEGNAGQAELRITNSVSSAVGVYNFKDNTLARSLAAQTGGVYIINNAPSGSQTTVNVGGNGFYDAYGNASGFAWLAAQTSGTANYTFNCAVSNHSDNSAEMQMLCQNPAANKFLQADSNNNYIGYGPAIGNAGAPVIYGGAGGTPSSVTLTNGTGLPIAGIAGTGSGVAAAMALATTGGGGLVRATAGTPSIASGACGTGTNGTISGSNLSGTITIGSATTPSCAISFSGTITAPNACVIFPGNSTAAAAGTTLAQVGAPSTTGWTITGNALASTVYRYTCL